MVWAAGTGQVHPATPVMHGGSARAVPVRGGRVFLPERAPRGDGSIGPEVSLRATGAVLRALTLAREPIFYCELATALTATTPNATPDKVDGLLSELWEQTLLLTDLRPPLTTDDPAKYVIQRLATIPPGA